MEDDGHEEVDQTASTQLILTANSLTQPGLNTPEIQRGVSSRNTSEVHLAAYHASYERKGHEAKNFTVTNSSSLTIGDQYIITQSEEQKGPNHSDIENWLQPIDFESVKDDLLAKLHKPTAEKVLQRSDFLMWYDTKGKWLWCHGMPGSAKTSLATTAIEHILAARETFRQDLGLAYIYCRHSLKSFSQTEYMRSLLFQLACQTKELTPSIRALYHKCTKRRPVKVLTMEDLERAFDAEIQQFSSVYVVVDALDECTNDDGGDFRPGTRTRLLESFARLGQKINLLITSRDRDPFCHATDSNSSIAKFSTMRMLTHDDDIISYTRARINGDAWLQKSVAKDKDLGFEIEQTIAMKAAGMFLPAKLYVDILSSAARSRNRAKIRQKLQDLPSFHEHEYWEVYRAAYEELLKDIWQQKNDTVKLVRDVLRWVIFSRDPLNLTLPMIQRALDLGEEGEDQAVQEDILTACRGIVTIDEHRLVVRLVHYTAETYFRNEKILETLFPEAEQEMAEACLAIIRSNIDPDHSLYQYAGRYWGKHAQLVESELTDSILDFVHEQHKLHLSFQPVINTLPLEWRWHISEPTNEADCLINPLHVAAFFDLCDLVDRLLNTDADSGVQDCRGFTPMRWAMIGGSLKVVSLLISKNVSVLCKDFGGMQSVFWAFGESLSLQREFPNDIEITDKSHVSLGDSIRIGSATSVHHAHVLPNLTTPRTNTEILKYIIAKCPGIGLVRNAKRATLLSVAAQNGQWEYWRLLIDRHADLDSTDASGMTPLLWALQSNLHFSQTVQKIRLHGGSTLKIGNATVFESAPEFDINTIAKFEPEIEREICRLIGSRLECRNTSGMTALSLAVANRLHRVCVELLKRGARVDIRDTNGLTPLHWSCGLPVFRSMEITEIQCHDSKLELGSVKHISLPIVQTQECRGHRIDRTIKLLLCNGASPSAFTNAGVTADAMAAIDGMECYIQALQQHKEVSGTQPESTDSIWSGRASDDMEFLDATQQTGYNQLVLAIVTQRERIRCRMISLQGISELTVGSTVSVDRLLTYGKAEAHIQGLTKINKLTAHEESHISMIEGTDCDAIRLDESSTLSIEGHATIKQLNCHGTSNAVVKGAGAISEIQLGGGSTLEVDGSTSIDSLYCVDDSTAMIKNATRISAIYLGGSSTLKIEGRTDIRLLYCDEKSKAVVQRDTAISNTQLCGSSALLIDGGSDVKILDRDNDFNRSDNGNTNLETIVLTGRAMLLTQGQNVIGTLTSRGNSRACFADFVKVRHAEALENSAIHFQSRWDIQNARGRISYGTIPKDMLPRMLDKAQEVVDAMV